MIVMNTSQNIRFLRILGMGLLEYSSKCFWRKTTILLNKLFDSQRNNICRRTNNNGIWIDRSVCYNLTKLHTVYEIIFIAILRTSDENLQLLKWVIGVNIFNIETSIFSLGRLIYLFILIYIFQTNW